MIGVCTGYIQLILLSEEEMRMIWVEICNIPEVVILDILMDADDTRRQPSSVDTWSMSSGFLSRGANLEDFAGRGVLPGNEHWFIY